MLSLLLISFIPSSVLGHGGMVFPPPWQDGNHLSIEEVWGKIVYSNPPVVDPNTGRKIDNINSWLTDQAYIGGHGTDEFLGGDGTVTNFEQGYCDKGCQNAKAPWAAPGKAPAFGGGCGVFGGNPYGCFSYNKTNDPWDDLSTTHNDKRRNGSICWSREGQDLGTFSYGSDAREVEFPQAATTEWGVGSVVQVASISTWYHRGGYTYRLCKLPEEGRMGLTEECFQKNILSFASDITYVRKWEENDNGKWYLGDWKEYLHQGEWEVDWKPEWVDGEHDVKVGTHPEGSVWRPVGINDHNNVINYIKKDDVWIPENLPLGDYVLSFRWDTAWGAQVWLSCANVRLVPPF